MTEIRTLAFFLVSSTPRMFGHMVDWLTSVDLPPPPAGFVRGGTLQRAPLNPMTFVPPAAPPVPSVPGAGRPPVPTKARVKQKPRRVISHYANPAEVALPDYHQSAPHMGERGRLPYPGPLTLSYTLQSSSSPSSLSKTSP